MRSEGTTIFTIVKSTGLALALSVLGVVAFAVVLQATALSGSVIYTVNQTLKILSIAVGTLAFVRGEKGWLKGGVTGILFTGVSYLAFSALGGDFTISWLIFAELVIAFLVGAISGALAVNLKK